MITTHKELTLTSLTPEQRARTCGYWYTIQRGAMAHNAWETNAALVSWLYVMNLHASEPIPPEGVHGYQKIIGEYTDHMHRNADTFESIQAERYIYKLSNGDYTLGKITTNAAGIVTVHYCNPNIRTRIVYPHRHTRARIAAGIFDADPTHTGRLCHNPYGYHDIKDPAITPEEWRAKEYHDYTSRLQDGRPAILTMSEKTGATILQPVSFKEG